MTVSVMYLFLAAPLVGLWSVIVAFAIYTHSLFVWNHARPYCKPLQNVSSSAVIFIGALRVKF